MCLASCLFSNEQLVFLIISKCEKYRGMADFYYLFDEHGILDKKDAPCDKGQEQLEFLMKRRIKIK